MTCCIAGPSHVILHLSAHPNHGQNMLKPLHLSRVLLFCNRENSQVPKPFIINSSTIITYNCKASSKIRENVRIGNTQGPCPTPIIPPKIQSITIVHFALDIIHKPINRVDTLFANRQQVSPPNGGHFKDFTML